MKKVIKEVIKEEELDIKSNNIKKNMIERHRKGMIISAAILVIFVVLCIIAYDQLNTAGGTKMSKLGVRKVKEQATTIKEKSDLQEILGKRMQLERDGKEPIDIIWYEPESYNGTDILPVFIYAHGGAWISLDAVDVDTYMQDVADLTPCIVVDLNYKLLQEKPFPYQQEEMVDTVKWLISNAEKLKIDSRNIVISGGSAGGHIAASTAIMLNKEHIDIRAEILEMAFLDFVNDSKNDMGIFNGLVDQLLESFSPNADAKDPIISPLRATKKDLEGICDTYFIAGLQDPLCKQAERYKKLLDSIGGIKTNFKEFDTNHGYTLNKKDKNDKTVSVIDAVNTRAGEKYKIRLLKHIFYGQDLPK